MDATPEIARPEKKRAAAQGDLDHASTATGTSDPAHADPRLPQSSPRQPPLLPVGTLQRTVGNRVVGRQLEQGSLTSVRRSTTMLVQRDKTSDRLKDLEDRTKLLEQKTKAFQLDLLYRGKFGKKLANYREIIYRMTGAFQTAFAGYQGAHGKQAAQDAVMDQIVTTLILVAGAAALEPFLTLSLGKLQGALANSSQRIANLDVTKIVEKLENPLNTAAQGYGNKVTTQRQGDRAGDPGTPAVPAKVGFGAGGGDPVSFLSSNLADIESHNGKIEGAFSDRAASYDTLSAEQWDALGDQAAMYEGLLKGLDAIALGDVDKLEAPQTLAVKIELYLWAGWIKAHQPGVAGLQIGSELAKRLKSLGVEGLADVIFDTESWIFMDHRPGGGLWERNLHQWADAWSQKITK